MKHDLVYRGGCWNDITEVKLFLAGCVSDSDSKDRDFDQYRPPRFTIHRYYIVPRRLCW